MKLAPASLMARWRPGSGPWSWPAELVDIAAREPEAFAALVASVRAVGVRVPVLLGNDARVWDGHHRICAAWVAGVEVPCRFVLPGGLAARARELWGEVAAPYSGAEPVPWGDTWAWLDEGRVVSVACWCCGDWCSPECIDGEGLCLDCEPSSPLGLA